MIYGATATLRGIRSSTSSFSERRGRGLIASVAEAARPFCPSVLCTMSSTYMSRLGPFRRACMRIAISCRKVGVGCVLESSLFEIHLRHAQDPQYAHGAYFPVQCPASRSARSAFVDPPYMHGISWNASVRGDSTILSAVRNRWIETDGRRLLIICTVQRCRRTVWLVLQSKSELCETCWLIVV